MQHSLVQCGTLRASMLGAPIGRIGWTAWPPLGDWVSIHLRVHLFALVLAVFFLSQSTAKQDGGTYLVGALRSQSTLELM